MLQGQNTFTDFAHGKGQIFPENFSLIWEILLSSDFQSFTSACISVSSLVNFLSAFVIKLNF